MAQSLAQTSRNQEQAFGLLAEAVMAVVGGERASAFSNLLRAKPAQLPRMIDLAKQRFRSFPPNVRDKIRNEVDRRFGKSEVVIDPTGRVKSKPKADTGKAKAETGKSSSDAIAKLANEGREITLDDLLRTA